MSAESAVWRNGGIHGHFPAAILCNACGVHDHRNPKMGAAAGQVNSCAPPWQCHVMFCCGLMLVIDVVLTMMCKLSQGLVTHVDTLSKAIQIPNTYRCQI